MLEPSRSDSSEKAALREALAASRKVAARATGQKFFEEGLMSDKARILVVEDDAFIALDVTEALKGFGYDVVASVPTGKAAIESAAQLKPDFILMDINLQGDMDGIQAAEAIHATSPTPLVFLTALSDEATLQRAKLTGPYGYLIKPFDPAELRSTIEIALDRYAATGGRVAEEDDTTLHEAALKAGLAGTAEEKAEVLRRIEFLSELPAPKLLALASVAEIVSVEGGTFIHTEDGKPDRSFVVLAGRVSVTKTSVSGKELILSLLGPGDCFALLYLLPSFDLVASARAQLDSKLLTFSRANASKILREIPELKDLLTAELAKRLSATYELAMSLAHSRVETRILGTLSTLVSTLARSSAKSQNEARIFITRRELADLTGTTPETAIRVTKQLERDGVLDLTRPGIIKIPDIEKLRALL